MRELVFSARKEDFDFSTFRSGGPGGQHQNKTDSGVRITHRASGLYAESRSSRSQKINKRVAFMRLVPLLVDHYCPTPDSVRRQSETVIRTYSEPRNSVKDNASGLVMEYSDVIGKCNIGPMIEARLLSETRGATQ